MVVIEKSFITVGKEHIAYYKFISDSSKHIFFIHGAFVHVGVYESLLTRLSIELNATIHAVDLLGHGFSTGVAGDLSVPDQQLMLESIIKSLMVSEQLPEKFYIMGHSLGGLLAVYVTTIFINQVNAMILISPLIKQGTVTTRYIDISFLGGYILHYLYLIARLLIPKMFLMWNNISATDLYQDRKLILKRISDPIVAKMTPFVSSLSIYDNTLNVDKNCLKTLEQHRVKSGFLIGQNDMITDNERTKEWSAILNADIITIQNAGHEMFIEDEQASIEAIKRLFHPL